MNILLSLLFFGLVFGQTAPVPRKSDRILAGYVGLVKQVLEEWSPLEKARYNIQPGTRCRTRAAVYDVQGRQIQSSAFSNSCGTDEHRDSYSYDAEGNYTIRSEEFHDPKSPPPPPPPMPPPGAKPRATGPPKAVFQYDARGRKREKSVLNSNGDLLYRIVWEWDEQDRMKEQQAYDAGGAMYSRGVYRYEGNQRFPVEWISYERGGKLSSQTAYTNYKVNAQGDWTERKETAQVVGQPTLVSLTIRTIAYHEKK